MTPYETFIKSKEESNGKPVSLAFNMDCMEGMKGFPDKFFDLAIVDPPYGINAANMTMGSSPKRGGRDERGELQYGSISVAQKLRKGRLNSGLSCDWDFYPPSIEYFTELFRISKNQVIWGGNYFTDKIPVSRCWICWDKKQPWDNFSQFELAWSSFDNPCKLISLSNRGGANDEDKIHPTQKPISVYDFTYTKFLPEGGRVIDTHLGSGSNRISAAKSGNVDFVAFEIDQSYFESQEKRFAQHKAQLKIFA